MSQPLNRRKLRQKMRKHKPLARSYKARDGTRNSWRARKALMPRLSCIEILMRSLFLSNPDSRVKFDHEESVTSNRSAEKICKEKVATWFGGDLMSPRGATNVA